MEHPKAIGDGSTLAAMTALREAGYRLYLPFGENTRTDLIIDDGDRLFRVQCKTGRLKQGAVVFKVCSTYAHHRSPSAVTRDYQGEIDYFAVYCRENQHVYLVPIEHLPLTHKAILRVDPPRNKQVRRIRPAADYDLGRVAVDATRVLRETAGGSRSSA
jgi:PD-(D/E)XK nuclease superfamily protein